MAQAARRKLIVTKLEPLGKPFQRKNGSTGQMLKVHATSVEGVPIRERLKTFARLPVGEELEVEVRLDEHPQYGRSFIVSLPAGRLGHQVDDHERRLAAVERKLGIPVQRSAA